MLPGREPRLFVKHAGRVRCCGVPCLLAQAASGGAGCLKPAEPGVAYSQRPTACLTAAPAPTHPTPRCASEHCVFCRFLSDGSDYRDCGHPCESHAVHLRDDKGGAAHGSRA